MLAQVLAFPVVAPSRVGWSAQELADIYRLSDILRRHGLDGELESGVSDEGEPWLVLSDANEAEVTAHIARIDGRYVVFRVDAEDPIYAESLRGIVDSLIARIRGGGSEADSIEDDDEAEDEPIDGLILYDPIGNEGASEPAAEGASLSGESVPRAVADERLEQLGHALLAMIIAVAKLGESPEAAAEALLDLVVAPDDAFEVSPTILDVLAPELVAEMATPSEDYADQDTILAFGEERDDSSVQAGSEEMEIGAAEEASDLPTVAASSQDSPRPEGSDQLGTEQAAADAPVAAARSNVGSPLTGELIVGTAGNDVIHGGPGDDTLIGGDGDDVILGGDGNDSVRGGDGDDELVGGNGDDVIEGGAGSDTLIGGNGADSMDGGAGSDLLVSNGGRDSLTGGAGEDLFVVIGSRPGNVTIDDFEQSQDRLVVLGSDQSSSTTAQDNSTSTIQVNAHTSIVIVGATPPADPLI